ncbi:MAG: hypothetical protein JWO42_154, partial [Chloroflexi bacterium]|nr:hypothetical protein [Chloroflexota bacterium]
ITDHAIAEMDTLGSAKESEVMAV